VSFNGNTGEQPAQADPELIRIYGYREMLKLDGRFRFRIPDPLSAKLNQEMGRLRGSSNMPPSAFERLSFYFVPGPSRKLYLYPPGNIDVAVDRFENPPASADPDQVRAARDYFYSQMRFVEADKQNRVVIPEHLREHAELGEDEDEVLLVSHNLWLELLPGSAAPEYESKGKDALEQVGADILDPVRRNDEDNNDPRP